MTLAACGKQEQKTVPADKAASAPTPGAAAAAIMLGKGVGTVTALNAQTGKITLDHGEIPELQWPPMEMEFAADPKLLAGFKADDKVEFEMSWDGRSGTITKVAKVP
ncbi:copper-binding protein [Sphingomonas koreensis]|uniref:copper-binding protein n=1 Tax=Sphingomonas koreensis TaxID=93064 RepID=UPI001F495CE4|nr:copper-binding protein [Sphingomonas koreensis]